MAELKYEYRLLESGDIEVVKVIGNVSELIVPPSIDGYRISGIASFAFVKLKEVTKITISEGISDINDTAFGYCDRLTSLIIPNSIKSADFVSSLHFGKNISIELSSDHPTLEVKEGVLFSKTNHCLLYYPEWKNDTEYVVPNGTMIIGNRAFAGNEVLTDIICPDSIDVIGKSAFSGCINIQRIRLPDNIKSIGDSAFCDCWSLKDFNIPNGIQYITDGMMFKCYSITSVEIPNTVIKIGEYAFRNCKSLQRVALPQSLLSIECGAFSGCDKITDIVIPENLTEEGFLQGFASCDSLFSISVTSANETMRSDNGVLFDNHQQRLIFYPRSKTEKEYIIPAQTLSISDRAFYGCKKIKNVIINQGMKIIGNQAFSNCYSLENVFIPDSVTEIGKEAFHSIRWFDRERDCHPIGFLTLIVIQGSYAEEYAKSHSIKYRYL